MSIAQASQCLANPLKAPCTRMVIIVYMVSTCVSVWTRLRAPYCKGEVHGPAIATATRDNKYLTGRWVQLGAECLLSHAQTPVKKAFESGILTMYNVAHPPPLLACMDPAVISTV
jgi:hypothetical protein